MLEISSSEPPSADCQKTLGPKRIAPLLGSRTAQPLAVAQPAAVCAASCGRGGRWQWRWRCSDHNGNFTVRRWSAGFLERAMSGLIHRGEASPSSRDENLQRVPCQMWIETFASMALQLGVDYISQDAGFTKVAPYGTRRARPSGQVSLVFPKLNLCYSNEVHVTLSNRRPAHTKTKSRSASCSGRRLFLARANSDQKPAVTQAPTPREAEANPFSRYDTKPTRKAQHGKTRSY